MYPFIKGMNGSARSSGLFGFKSISETEMAHTEEELRIILSDSFKSGEINQSEYKYVNQIFEFDERIANEIMVPRTEMITIEKEMTLREVFEVMGVEQYTRYPVTDGDKDHIIGLVNMKHLLTAFIKEPDKLAYNQLLTICNRLFSVIETIPIGDLITQNATRTNSYGDFNG